MTQEEKERIDYEIKAKINARNKEFGDWVFSAFLAIIVFGLIRYLFYTFLML